VKPVEIVFVPATTLPRFGLSVSMKNVTFGESWPPTRRRARRRKRFCW
jgi:hypothetical protein